jgi:hypothetical protein
MIRFMRRITWQILGILCVLCLSFYLGKPATWRVVENVAVSELGHGAVLIERQLGGPAQVRLSVVVFDSDKCSLRLVSQQQVRGGKSAPELLGKSLAISNGGYFDLQSIGMLPTGLEIADGVRSGKFEPVGSSTGALVVRASEMVLVSERDFKDGSDITQCVECGPLLHYKGVANPMMGKEMRANRTFIGTDGGRRWCLGVIEAVELKQLAAILKTPGILDECPIQTALNLDGGPSTSLAWHDPKVEVKVVPQAPIVRNYLQVVPR